MVDFQFHKHLEILHVEWGDEYELIQPTYSQLMDCLDRVRQEYCVNHCIECAVRLLGELDVKLYLLRVNDIEQGKFLGWIVQLSSNSEFNSFLLANTPDANYNSRHFSTSVEMLGGCEKVDSRCILSHVELQRWIRHELMGTGGVKHYRWIELGLALQAVD